VEGLRSFSELLGSSGHLNGRCSQAATPACTVCAPRKHQAKTRPYINSNTWPFRNSMLPLSRHSKRFQPPTQPSTTNQRCVFARHSKLMCALQQAQQVCWLLVPPKIRLMSANTCLPRPRARPWLGDETQKALVSSPLRAQIHGHAPENTQIRATG